MVELENVIVGLEIGFMGFVVFGIVCCCLVVIGIFSINFGVRFVVVFGFSLLSCFMVILFFLVML